MAQFFHVYISPRPEVSTEAIEAQMDKALDWFRYGQGIYIVYTTSDQDKLYSRLEKLVKPEGSVFICKFDEKVRQGWMVKDFWNWLKKKR